MFEAADKHLRSTSGRKCPIDGTSPVAIHTPLPTTPSTFRPRKGTKPHGIGDDAMPPQILKMFERASPSKSPAAETPREMQRQEMQAPPPPPPAAHGLDQFDRQLPDNFRMPIGGFQHQHAQHQGQRPAGSAAVAAVAAPRQSRQDSPSTQQRGDSIAKAIEAHRSTIADGIKRLLEDYAKKFTSPSSPSPTSAAAAASLPAEDPLARIVKHYHLNSQGSPGASPFPLAAGVQRGGGTPNGPVDKEVSGLVAPITKRYTDPALQAIPKPKADTEGRPITEELLREAQEGARASTKKLLRSDKSNFSETSSKKVGASSPMSPMKRVDS